MEIHYSKHHQGYVNKLNAALEGQKDLGLSLEEMLKNLSVLPEGLRNAVRNNGGGHFNHSLFWPQLKINNQDSPRGDLLEALNNKFGSYDNFKKEFSKAAGTRFGSGWAWLILDDSGELHVTSTPNQDTPLNLGKPILALDVWEHAYYLNYQNRRPDYVSAFFSIIDWDLIEKRYAEK
jgi:Fe-Mn family superoxide dismutase